MSIPFDIPQSIPTGEGNQKGSTFEIQGSGLLVSQAFGLKGTVNAGAARFLSSASAAAVSVASHLASQGHSLIPSARRASSVLLPAFAVAYDAVVGQKANRVALVSASEVRSGHVVDHTGAAVAVGSHELRHLLNAVASGGAVSIGGATFEVEYEISAHGLVIVAVRPVTGRTLKVRGGRVFKVIDINRTLKVGPN